MEAERNLSNWGAVISDEEGDKRQTGLTFALSPESGDHASMLEDEDEPKVTKKPLKKSIFSSFDPNASEFVPKATPTATQKELEQSFAQKEQVLLEESTNEFSICYDEIRAEKKVSAIDFEVLKLVGEGGFGKVFQVRHIATKRIYAMKTLRKKFLVNTNNVGYTFVERNVLRKVRHPFVCGLHFAFQTKGKVYLVMDFLNGGQIFYHLKRQTMFGETEVQFYAAEITLALTHLHSLGILHRDLVRASCCSLFFSSPAFFPTFFPLLIVVRSEAREHSARWKRTRTPDRLWSRARLGGSRRG